MTNINGMKKILITGLLLLVSQFSNAAYSPSSAVSYAVSNYKVSYGAATNPFIDVGAEIIGGNCTNFANQAISGGMLKIVSPVSLNKQFTTNTIGAQNLRNVSIFYKCNSVSNSCQTPTWRGAQNMFTYSRDSIASQKSGVKLQLVTKTALVNGAIQPMDYKAVKSGDIVFFDFNYKIGSSANSVDHTAVVTQINPERIYDITTSMKYNNIRLTYQSNNETDRGLADVKDSKPDGGVGVVYIYRPI